MQMIRCNKTGNNAWCMKLSHSSQVQWLLGKLNPRVTWLVPIVSSVSNPRGCL